MLVYFKNGCSAWFVEARNCEFDGGIFRILGARNHQIAEINRAEMLFWHYDNEDVTTFGFKETADAK